jgi:hypothetical protein
VEKNYALSSSLDKFLNSNNLALSPNYLNLTLPPPNYLTGVWNLTGTSNGYPVSGQIQFGINNEYQISGKLSNIQTGNVLPFYYLGKYSLDKKNNTLSLTTNTGIETTYRLANIKKNSLSASNPTTSEYYTYTKIAD